MGAVLNFEGTWQSANIRNLKKFQESLNVPEVECGFGILRESFRLAGEPGGPPPGHHPHKRGSREKHAAVGEEAASGAGKGRIMRLYF